MILTDDVDVDVDVDVDADVDVLVPSEVLPVVVLLVRRAVTEMLAPVGRGTSSASPSMTYS